MREDRFSWGDGDIVFEDESQTGEKSWQNEGFAGAIVAPPQQSSRRKRADQLIGGDVIEWRGGQRTVAVADHAGGGKIEIQFNDGGVGMVTGGDVFEVLSNLYRKRLPPSALTKSLKYRGKGSYFDSCPRDTSTAKRLPRSMLSKSLRYFTKGEGEPCKQGETSTQSGCIPAEGDAKTPQHGQESKPEEPAKEKLPVEPPYKPTMTDEQIEKGVWAYKFRTDAQIMKGEKAGSRMPLGDKLRALDLEMGGKKPGSDIKLTDYAFTIADQLERRGIDLFELSDDELFNTLEQHGYISAEHGKYDLNNKYGIRAEAVVKSATDEEKEKLIPYLADKLAASEEKQHNGSYYDPGINSFSTPQQKRAWADAVEDAAGSKPLVLKYDKEDGKNEIDYSSGLTVARVHNWTYTRNYDAFVSGMASGWASSGGGVTAQKVTNTITKKNQQNADKGFWTPEGSRAENEDFDEERIAAHVSQLQKTTQDYYKKKFGKKNAESFDLSTKELVLYRGVGGAVETYMPSPVESWTTDAKGTPQRFGKQHAKNVGYRRSAYTVLQARVTYADILFSYETMKNVPGWPPEKRLKGKKEFVPFGGALRDIQAEVVYQEEKR